MLSIAKVCGGLRQRAEQWTQLDTGRVAHQLEQTAMSRNGILQLEGRHGQQQGETAENARAATSAEASYGENASKAFAPPESTLREASNSMRRLMTVSGA